MELLNKLGSRKSMGGDGTQPWLLRKLADVIVKPLLTVFKRIWQSGEVPENCKKEKVTALNSRFLDKAIFNNSLQPPQFHNFIILSLF